MGLSEACVLLKTGAEYILESKELIESSDKELDQ